jgi:hypothetical protein
MNAVTDIFAFAAEHADYWSEFLSGADYSAVLSVDEMKALEAARLHVEEGIYDLLLECGAKLESKLAAHGVSSRAFQKGATAKNRKVRVDAPGPWKDRLYGLEFEFSPDDDNERILLFGSLVVMKRAMEKSAAAIAAKGGLEFKVDGYYIYGPGTPLAKDTTFDALADKVAGGLGGLFLALV